MRNYSISSRLSPTFKNKETLQFFFFFIPPISSVCCLVEMVVLGVSGCDVKLFSIITFFILMPFERLTSCALYVISYIRSPLKCKVSLFTLSCCITFIYIFLFCNHWGVTNYGSLISYEPRPLLLYTVVSRATKASLLAMLSGGLGLR